jgi:hypothetical protein
MTSPVRGSTRLKSLSLSSVQFAVDPRTYESLATGTSFIGQRSKMQSTSGHKTGTHGLIEFARNA